jgi:drug/metabolite transporter (DMT)-like permease
MRTAPPAALAAAQRQDPHPRTGPSTRDLVLVHLGLLFVAILWGGNFTALKHLLGPLQPVDVVVIRSIAAALFYVAFLAATGRLVIPVTRPDLRRMILIGALGIPVMGLSMAYGLNRLDAGLASLLVTSNPIFTAIISRIVLGEALTSRKIAGILLAFAGFLIVLQFGASGGARMETDQMIGVLIVLAGPLAWAFYTVLSKPLLGRYPPIHVASYTTVAGGAVFVPVLLLDAPMRDRMMGLGAVDWLAVMYVSLLAITVAYLIWYWGLRVLTPSQTAVYIYLVPVFGVLVSWIVLGETPTVFALLGGAVIVAGVVLTNTSSRRRQRAV